MIYESIKKLANEYAHVYSFVGDDTMPRKKKELEDAIENLKATHEAELKNAKLEVLDELEGLFYRGHLEHYTPHMVCHTKEDWKKIFERIAELKQSITEGDLCVRE